MAPIRTLLVDFFLMLRSAGIPVSVTEYLTLLDALSRRVAGYSVDDFYYLARASLVKDERHFDRFDRVFGAHFQGMQELFDEVVGEIPEEWLRLAGMGNLSEEEKQQIEALGGWEKLMETLRERLAEQRERHQGGSKWRLAEQRERHQGGSKWIGTGGTSPFGAYGYNPEGVRIGQNGSRNRRAVKVWDRREFKNLDDSVEIGTRNIKVALRRLRLDDTIRSTARNAGLLDLKLVPERHNSVKVLLFLDVGGSMEDHVKICQELFSAARSEFKHLEYYYFHNFIYESVWKDNGRRMRERVPTDELMHTYGSDHKLIFIGDASMSPYEIIHPGGSVEHWNEEPGAVWMGRLLHTYGNAIWLNPEPVQRWEYTPSIGITREIMNERMFPLTLAGLDQGIKELQS
jgi:uncharacterized protein with von Willebrand factor type A (vWA) domain